MEITSPKPFVFVLMPFSEDFRDIYDLGIKQACANAGAYCERVDEQIFHENILERLYNQIAKADVIVADMTGRNLNVFYEVGYAHALNKKVVLLTQNADDIPFDLKHYSHIVYGGKITNLIAQLEPRVRYFITNNRKNHISEDFSLEFYLGNVLIKDEPAVPCNNCYFEYDYGEAGSWIFDSTLHIHNVSTKIISDKMCKIAIILPKDYFAIGKSVTDRVSLPDDTLLSFLKFPDTMFPGEWKELPMSFSLSHVTVCPLDVTSKVRLLKETGSTDYPFTFLVNTESMMPADDDDIPFSDVDSVTFSDDDDIPSIPADDDIPF